MTDRPLTILFMPESAYGPTNQCVGIGKVLLERGHRVVFAAEASWKGKLAPMGFEEDLVDLAPPAEDADEQDAGQFWKDFIRDTAPEFRKPTIDQLATFMQPTWQALIDGAIYCEPQLRQIIERVRPDVIVEDNVVAFPALLTSGAPFVRIVSCNPLEMKGPDVAPGVLGAAGRRPWGVGGVPRRVRPHPPGDVGGLQRLGGRAGCCAAGGPGVHPRVGRGQHLRLPAGGGLHGSASAVVHVAPHGLERPRDRRPVRGSGRGRRPSRGQRARLRLAGVAGRC